MGKGRNEREIRGMGMEVKSREQEGRRRASHSRAFLGKSELGGERPGDVLGEEWNFRLHGGGPMSHVPRD